METVLLLINYVATVIWWLVVIHLVTGLLIQFDVVNPRQPLVSGIYFGIGRLLDPMLDPIRRILPPTGGLDFSPMVLLILLALLQIAIANNIGAF